MLQSSTQISRDATPPWSPQAGWVSLGVSLAASLSAVHAAVAPAWQPDEKPRSQDAVDGGICKPADLIKKLSFLPLGGKWRTRWKWLARSPLPCKVRQTLWRRWVQKLFLGDKHPLIDALPNDDPLQVLTASCL